MALFNFTNLTSGSLRTRYIEADPNGSGLPVFDLDAQQIAFEYNDGYWTALALNGLISTDYDLNLDASGFSDPDPLNSDARIIKRTGTGDWTIDGSNGTFSGTVLERLGCSGIDNSSGSHFGIGTGNCFTISSNPSSLVRCAGSSAIFSVAITGGYGTVNYQWLKDGDIISDGGDISGATTNSLTINNLDRDDAAAYSCMITDNCSTQETQAACLSIPDPEPTLFYAYQKSLTH